MIELIEANWPLFLIALLIGIAVAWFMFRAARRTKVQTDRRDVLDEDAAPAARNQALIDAAPASAPKVSTPVVPPATPMGLAGAGAAVSAAAEAASADDRAGEARARAQAPTPTKVAGTTSGSGDDLGRIKGVGPKLQAMLHDEGVTSFAQIAAWSNADIDRIDAKLGRFAGRIRRDDWVTQAALLEQGDTGAYEGKFGKL